MYRESRENRENRKKSTERVIFRMFARVSLTFLWLREQIVLKQNIYDQKCYRIIKIMNKQEVTI